MQRGTEGLLHWLQPLLIVPPTIDPVAVDGPSNLLGASNDAAYYNDPLAFVPNLHGAALERVRKQVHITVVVGRGQHEEGCIPETVEFSLPREVR